MEAIAQEACAGGIHDLAASGFGVGRGDFRHVPIIKRMTVLDNRPDEA